MICEGSAITLPFPDAPLICACVSSGFSFSGPARLQYVRCSEFYNSMVGWH